MNGMLSGRYRDKENLVFFSSCICQPASVRWQRGGSMLTRMSIAILVLLVSISFLKTVEARDPMEGIPGARQNWRYGKAWPPFPRPIGRRASFTTQYHHNYYWPHEFTCQDRMNLRSALQAQVTNGWTSETTLYDYHFDPETNTLNAAGKRKLRWILEQTPMQYRAAYVASSETQLENQTKLLAVQLAATELVGTDALPPISIRVSRATGTSAEEIDGVRRAWMKGAPSPRLPYTPLGNSGGSSGGGSSATGM